MLLIEVMNNVEKIIDSPSPPIIFILFTLAQLRLVKRSRLNEQRSELQLSPYSPRIHWLVTMTGKSKTEIILDGRLSHTRA